MNREGIRSTIPSSTASSRLSCGLRRPHWKTICLLRRAGGTAAPQPARCRRYCEIVLILTTPYVHNPIRGMETTATVTSAHRLKRVLTLWDLIFYGIVLIQPIAPVPLYGVAQKLSDGHFATIILIAMFAMLITAVSYGRMAALYPSAGSAYTYVGKGLNPHLGFFAGWAMLLCYVMFPLINVIYVSVTLHRVFPFIPYILAAIFCAAAMTLLNLRGVRA